MDDNKREQINERMQTGEAFDAFLTARVHGAYDQVQLPEESFARMLGQLSQASAGRTAVSDAPLLNDQVDYDGNAGASNSEAAGVYAAQARKRNLRVLRFALPVAACLMIALIAGVVAFNMPTNSSDVASMSAETTHEESASESNGRDSDMAYDYADEAPADSEDACAAPPATPDDFIGDSESGDVAVSDDGAMSTGQEYDAFDEAEEGSAKTSEGSLAQDFPRIELASGQELQVAADSTGTPQAVDSSQIVQYLEDAKAYPAGSQTPEACAIYVTVDGEYAVSFEGDSAFYLVESAS